MTQIETDAVLEKLHFQVEQQAERIATLERERDEARAERDNAAASLVNAVIQREELDVIGLAQYRRLTHSEWNTLRNVIAYAVNAADDLIRSNMPGLVELGISRKKDCEKAFALSWAIGFEPEGHN